MWKVDHHGTWKEPQGKAREKNFFFNSCGGVCRIPHASLRDWTCCRIQRLDLLWYSFYNETLCPSTLEAAGCRRGAQAWTVKFHVSCEKQRGENRNRGSPGNLLNVFLHEFLVLGCSQHRESREKKTSRKPTTIEPPACRFQPSLQIVDDPAEWYHCCCSRTPPLEAH